MTNTTYQDLAQTPDLDAASTFADYPVWTHTLALPPQPLMGSTGTYELPIFLLVGHSWAQVVSHFTKPGSTILDIGCGCGKTARFLTNNQHIARYVGFDVLKLSIDWTRHYLSPATQGRFEFHHADLRNEMYNPHGTIQACDYRFPVADGSVDLAFAASLFTHLLERDCRHYLRETARVLKAGGRTIISVHMEPAPGTRYSGTEARIDVEIEFFVELAAGAGLKLIERPGDLCGQEILVFERVA
ncbi:MAG: class I SAM-dependent methyltransferase [Burkholderiales bacterium]|nr:class I SAM-dependent methyltransferase [Burkholderiales bacterium]